MLLVKELGGVITKKQYLSYKNKKKRSNRILVISFFIIITILISSAFIYILSLRNSDEQVFTSYASESENEEQKIIQSDTAEFVSKYLNEQRQNIHPEGDDGAKVVYLTFDDGPSKTVTPRILDILKEKNVNATFFTLGKYIDKGDEEKELIKRAYNDGNSIGIHTYSHEYKSLYPNNIPNADNIMSEIEKTKVSLRSVLGPQFDTNIVRLPGGHMSWKGLEETDKRFKENGYYSIDWNQILGDAEKKKRTPEELLNYLKSQHKYRRAVVLMHDTYEKETTADILPELIDYYKSEGYEFRIIKG